MVPAPFSDQGHCFEWFLEEGARELEALQKCMSPVQNAILVQHTSPISDSSAGSVTVELGGSKGTCSITLQLVEEGNPSIVITADCGPLAAHKALGRQIQEILSKVSLRFEEPSVERGWLLQYSVSLSLIASGPSNIPALATAFSECFKAATRPADLYANQSPRIPILDPSVEPLLAARFIYVSSKSGVIQIRNPTATQSRISMGHMDVVMQGESIYFLDAYNVPVDMMKSFFQLLRQSV